MGMFFWTFWTQNFLIVFIVTKMQPLKFMYVCVCVE